MYKTRSERRTEKGQCVKVAKKNTLPQTAFFGDFAHWEERKEGRILEGLAFEYTYIA